MDHDGRSVAWATAGTLHYHAGELSAALDCFERAVSYAPSVASHHANLAGVAFAALELDRAERHARLALAIEPDHVDASFNLAQVLRVQGQLEEACALLERLARAHPVDVEVRRAHARVLAALGRVPEAVAESGAAVALHPDDPSVHDSHAALLRRAGDLDAARHHAMRAFALAPTDGTRGLKALEAARMVCDWSQEPTDWDATIAPACAVREPCASFFSLSLPLSPTRLRELAAVEGRWLEATAERTADWRAGVHRPARTHRIRVGYVTPDFRDHPTSHLTQAMFGEHDRSRFEVFAYACGTDDGSAYRRRIERDVEHFVDASELEAVSLARRISSDGIDILVDLNGYTSGHRLDVFALRPAPVQVHYLGYPGPLSAGFIDYFIADAVVAPAGYDAHFREALVRMPHSYQVNDNRQPIDARPFPRDRCALPRRGFVFAAFHAGHKLDPTVFASWMRILTRVRDSVLWLLATSHGMVANLRAFAAQRGVSPDRLVFATRLPKPRHLARLRNADLALDTLFYGGHTTGSDALWAGVPVLTCPGDTFASRVGASLLQAVHLDGLVAADLAHYEEAAVALADDPARTQALREQLANVAATPLYDTRQTTRDLERAYAQMHERRGAGLPPEAFDVRTVGPHGTITRASGC